MPLNKKKLSEVEVFENILIATAIYEFQIEEAKTETQKKGSGENLVLQLKITDPQITLADGREIDNPGMVYVWDRISLEPKETPGKKPYDPDESLRMLGDAIGHDPDADLEIADLQGRSGQVKVKLTDSRTDPLSGKTYEPRNEVARYIKAEIEKPY